jgi:hypothetical protein
MTRSRRLDVYLLVASAGSLAVLLLLRVYAVFAFPSVRTPWDDRVYRVDARAVAAAETAPQTVRKLLLPHKAVMSEGRLNGYNDWLVAAFKGHRAVGIGNSERAFQLLNVLLLLAQVVAVWWLAWWSLRDRALAATFSFLYVAAPVVFGTSRWVHTENLVLAAGVVLSGLAIWLLEQPAAAGARSWPSRAGRAAVAAWGIGLCTMAREYAAPSFVVIVVATLLALCLRRRWLESGVMALVTAAFVVPWVPSLVAAFKLTLTKGGDDSYFHPMREWIPHVALHTVGPALLAVLAGLGAAVAYQRIRLLVWSLGDPTRSLGDRLRAQLAGVRPLFWGHLFLLLLYAAGIVWTRNRVTRPAIMLMLAGIGFVLIGIQTVPALRTRLHAAAAKVVALGLVALSWAVLTYQLMFAFDGGQTYAHASFRLEYFNYPLRLRALKDGGDSYTCGDVCPYDVR